MRTKGAALATATNWLTNFVIVEITPIGIQNVGWRFYIIFTVTNALILPVVYFLYPETCKSPYPSLFILPSARKTLRRFVTDGDGAWQPTARSRIWMRTTAKTRRWSLWGIKTRFRAGGRRNSSRCRKRTCSRRRARGLGARVMWESWVSRRLGRDGAGGGEGGYSDVVGKLDAMGISRLDNWKLLALSLLKDVGHEAI